MTDLTNGRVAKDRKKATLHAIRRYPESQIADYEAALTVCRAKVLGMTIARTLIAPRPMSAHSVTFIVPNPLQRREKLTRCGSERFLTVRPHSNSPAIQDADVRALGCGKLDRAIGRFRFRGLHAAMCSLGKTAKRCGLPPTAWPLCCVEPHEMDFVT